MEKFTAIYVKSWMVGSREYSLPKMKRFIKKENETVIAAMQREGIAVETIFLFKGWPLLEGEKNERN